jgi:phosphoribosylformylglycinamidine cyclo-ligase
MVNYADSGVNILLGDDASKILYNAAKLTWAKRKGKLGELIVPFDDFSGIRAIDVSMLPPGTLMNIGFDGVGTKMEIAERMNNHRTIAFDLFAMVCDDALVRGAEPVLIGSILDVNSLGIGDKSHIGKIIQLAEGYVNAAGDANVVIVNGELAELGSRVGGYGPFNYNWGAAVVWFTHRSKMLTGHNIRKGDYLVGFQENGFRSNGLSLVRKILREEHGEEWHNKEFEGSTLGEHVLRPSKIYTSAVVEMLGGYHPDVKGTAEIHGIAHITGGGIPGKLGRVLKPSGLGATINDLFHPSPIMEYCRKKGEVEDAHTAWNMGTGMIIITPEPENVIATASKYDIKSKVIGKITGSRRAINIRGHDNKNDVSETYYYDRK